MVDGMQRGKLVPLYISMKTKVDIISYLGSDFWEDLKTYCFYVRPLDDRSNAFNLGWYPDKSAYMDAYLIKYYEK